MSARAPRLDTLALGLGAALFLAYLLVAPPRLNHDVAQYLSGGLVLVEGGRPYVEVVDTNPPMILYLSAVPAAVSAATGWPLDRVGLVFLAALFAGAFALFARTLRAVIPDDDARARAVAVVGAGWLWLLIGTHCGAVVPQFGQRDALIGAFVLPFLAVRHGRYAGASPGRGAAGAAGVLALVAAGMKPQYLLVLAALDGALALAHRRRPAIGTPEALAFLAAGLAYALHFLAVPGMASFYTEWLGYMRRGYAAYETAAGAVLGTFRFRSLVGFGLPLGVAALVSAGAVGVGLRARGGLRFGATVGAFGLLAAVVYLAQAKGWAYQALPLQLAAVTALGLGGAHALGAVARRAGPVVAQAAAAALVLGLVAATLGPPTAITSPALVAALEARSAPDDRVLVLSPRVQSAWPALTHAGRRPAGRFLTTYPLVFFYHGADGYRAPPAWAAQEAAFYADLARTVARDRPALIVVNVATGTHRALPPWFAVDGYLRHRGFFEGPGAGYVAVDTVHASGVGPHVVLARRPAERASLAAPGS